MTPKEKVEEHEDLLREVANINDAESAKYAKQLLNQIDS